MLTDWIHWLSSIKAESLVWIFLPFLLFDGMRYTFLMSGMAIVDCVRDSFRWLFGGTAETNCRYCPSVAVIIVGFNEGDTIQHALSSIYGTYPRMEVFVVDDGSTDGMADKALAFARQHSGVTVLRREKRGGKSSALNMPLPLVRAEIVVVIDSDSHLDDATIWHIVQPFQDAAVGAVSGCISSRNPFVNLVTWVQALEYRRSILLGRIFLSRLGLLGIVSGALGAFRKDVLDRVGGWDVGPGEDGDLTIKIRKSGYRIAFQPAANCLTNTPVKAGALIRQRRRWEWAAITFECRKHVDLGNPFRKQFRLSDFVMMVERWLFNFILVYAGVIFIIYLLCSHSVQHVIYLAITFYVAYLACDVIQLLILFYYSQQRPGDVVLGLATPLMPVYFLAQKMVTCWAITEELILRRSYQDNFVPERVRRVTWHW